MGTKGRVEVVEEGEAMKAGDLVSFWSYGEKCVGIVIDDDERNHAGVRFFVTFSPGHNPLIATGLHHNYYDRLDKPMGPDHPGEKCVEVISESQ